MVMVCRVSFSSASGSLGGEISAERRYWMPTSATGSTRYAPASSQPMGGWPSSKGKSQAVPAPDFLSASEVGPASEGIQKKPSFSRTPSLATLPSE